MEPHLQSNTQQREPRQESAFSSRYQDACPPPTRNPTPGSPLSFPPTFGGGLPISASDRSPLAGVCSPQLLGHRSTQSAQDALAKEGRRLVGGDTGQQRPGEVGGAKAHTGFGRRASAPHVGTAHAVGRAVAAPPTSAAALALAAPAACLGRGAGLLASVKPRVNRREAERQHALRRVDVCLRVVRELCGGWSWSALRQRVGEGKASAGNAGAAERARRPDAWAGGAPGGRGAAPLALAADRREGAYWRDPTCASTVFVSAAPRRAGDSATPFAEPRGDPELTVVGAGDLPT
ncbi:hypothetical protein NN561_013777 [Cricetulus griseus]